MQDEIFHLRINKDGSIDLLDSEKEMITPVTKEGNNIVINADKRQRAGSD